MTDTRQREFLELLEPVYDRLSRYALAITRNEMDAEDLVSATVLKAFEQFDRIKDSERFLHYLLTIASRLHKRRRYRERNKVAYDAELATLRQADTQSPEQAAELRIVMDALQRLPERMRETLVLFEVADLSLEEIRGVQGGTLSGVKSRLRRGRELLSKALGIPPIEQSRTARKEKRMIFREEAPILLLAEESYGR